METLKQKLAEIKAGTTVMDKALMVDLVEDFGQASPYYESSEIPFLFSRFEDPASRAKRWDVQWLNVSQPEWIDILIDILADPPAEMVRYFGGPKSEWQSLVVLFAGEVGKATRAKEALHRITPLLQNDRLQAWIIGIIGLLEIPEGLEFIKPFVPRIGDLSIDAATEVVNALGSIGGSESHLLLQQIHHSLPEHLQFLEEDINDYLQKSE